VCAHNRRFGLLGVRFVGLGNASGVDLADQLTLGVEEEFLVVDLASGLVVPRRDAVLEAAGRRLGDRVTAELNLCQIEVGTEVCTSLDQLRASLAELRTGLVEAAGELALGVLASGTPAAGLWEDQRVDRTVPRFSRMEDQYQVVCREQIICGAHVHVGIDDRDLAVETMNRVRPWLPSLLALSANSPFWQGADTGYASYRVQVWQRWPTSGMPPHLRSWAEYEALVAELVGMEAIEDASFLYWYARPSMRWPTIELRACDVCLTVDDAVTIAGLGRALVWTCARDALLDQPTPAPRREVLDAAMWRAARYGLEATLVHPGARDVRPAGQVVADLLAFCDEGLAHHGDLVTVSDGVATILRDGNGARRQRLAFSHRGDPADVVGLVTKSAAAGPVPLPSPAAVA
jgi:carboxylate-amine ligase